MLTRWRNAAAEIRLTTEQRESAEAAVRTFVEIVSRVPEPYQQILYLRELQGLASEEIADVLALSGVSVELLFAEARKRFKSAYLQAMAQQEPLRA
jgi:DNA-directed RNA polymerase specialized sigma24 family protein